MKKIYLLFIVVCLIITNKDLFAQCSVNISTNTNTTELNCNTASITLKADTAGTGGNIYAFLWSTSAITTSISVTVPGTYTVTLSSVGICTATQSIIITSAPVVTVSAFPSTICSGSAASLVGFGANTYSWQPGSLSGTTVSVSPAATTIYTVTGIGTNGCTATSTVQIIVNQLPSITVQPATASQTVCLYDSTAITPLTITATGGANFQWFSNIIASNASGTIILGANANTYKPLTTNAGILYYWCRVIGPCTPSAKSNPSGAITINAPPTIISQTTAAETICLNGTAIALSINASGAGLTYQWFKNTTSSNSGGTIIAGATSSSYTPLSNTSGTLYYYCIVGGTCTPFVTSVISGPITVSSSSNINTQPSSVTQTICLGGLATQLSVIASGAGLTYQWYSNNNPSNTGGTTIVGATADTYIPSSAASGTFYYYCIVIGSCSPPITSSVSGAVTFNDLPSISSQSTIAETICLNGIATPLTINATGSGLNYQWFSNTTASNSGGTLILGASFSSHTPLTGNPGTLYYYCIVSGICTPSVTSVVSGAINISDAVNVTNQPSITNQTICLGSAAIPLVITVAGAGLTYQWYSNTTSTNSGGSLINGATADTYIPSTATSGALYYYCVISGSCSSAVTSDVSGAITINESPSIINQVTGAQTICLGITASPLSVSATGDSLYYQWYSNTVPNNTGGLMLTNDTLASYTPLTTSAGTLYYYCIVSGYCTPSVTSVISGAIIISDAVDITGETLAAQTICLNVTATQLSVAATGVGLTYQWYSNTSGNNAGGISIFGATTMSYIPLTTDTGTLYYYCVISDSCGSIVTSSVSGTITVESPPVITQQPSTATQTICLNGFSTQLSITVIGPGLTYQWYQNSIASNAGGTIIPGATTSLYIPPTNSSVTRYYYCVITGTCAPPLTTSDVSGAIIVEAPPAITTQPTTITQTICLNETASPLAIIATGAGLTYQWYSNTIASNTGGLLLTNDTLATYTPSTILAVTQYYYCVVSGTCVPTSAASDVSGAIIINPLPTATIAGGNQVCQFASPSPNITFAGAVGPTPYTFYYHIGNGSTLSVTTTGVSSSTDVPAPTALLGTYTYYLDSVTDGNGCTQFQSDSDSIAILQQPVITSINDTIICNNSTFIYTGTCSPGIVNGWTRQPKSEINNNSPGSGSLDSINEPLNNISDFAVDVYYVFMLQNGGCIVYDSIKVTVYPTAIIATVNNISFCNNDSSNGFVFTSASPNTNFKWTCNPSIGFGSSGSSNTITQFYATNQTDSIINSTVTVFVWLNIPNSNDSCFGEPITFTITVNPSPPKPNFTSLQFYPQTDTLHLCSGSENINFNVNSSSGISFQWSETTSNSNVTIRDMNDTNTVISFNGAGTYIIQLVDSNTIGGCKDTAQQIVIVDTTSGIVERQIIYKIIPGILLIYPDNTMDAVYGYQWGYDTIYQSSPNSILGPPVSIQNQVYQFFIPDDKYIDKSTMLLDTIHYAFWVLLKKDGCLTKVYLNGPYQNRPIEILPVYNTIKLYVFPNPGNGDFNIELQGAIYGSIHARIYNSIGAMVYKKSFNKELQLAKQQFDLKHLADGLYYLELNSSDLQKINARILIQH